MIKKLLSSLLRINKTFGKHNLSFTAGELKGFPLLWYGGIWCVILSVYSLHLINYPPLSIKFYIVMLLSVIGIFTGLMVGFNSISLFSIKTRVANREIFVKNLRKNSTQIGVVFWACCIAGFLGVVLMYISVFSQISIVDFFLKQSMVKAEIERSWIGTYLSMGAFIAIPLGVILWYGIGYGCIYMIFPLVLCFFFSLSFFGRVPFVMGLIMFTAAMSMTRLCLPSPNHIRPQKKVFFRNFFFVVSMPIIFFSFLSWTLYFRISEYKAIGNYNPYKNYTNSAVTEVLEKYSFLFGSPEAGIITYSYLANPIATLNYWVSQDSEYGLGQASFPYFFRLATTIGLMDKPTVRGNRSVTNLGLQLPTYLGYSYLDFGFIGVIFYSFMLSFISTKFYLSFMVHPKINTYLYLSFVYMLILFSPLIFVFEWTEAAIILVGLSGISWILSLRSLPFIKNVRLTSLGSINDVECHE